MAMTAPGKAFRAEAPGGVAFEAGKLARLAGGAVLATAADGTAVLATVVCSHGDAGGDDRGFLPLIVDYRERSAAVSKIPGTLMRREGPPRERETLASRAIDRCLRPLFPPGFSADVQIMASVLAAGGEADPDVLAINAASAALHSSDVPWGGPLGAVRIGRVAGQLVVNPKPMELAESDLSLLYAGTEDRTLMLEAQASGISDKDFCAALKLAHDEVAKLLPAQRRLAELVGAAKRGVKAAEAYADVVAKVRGLAAPAIESVLTNPAYGKVRRSAMEQRLHMTTFVHLKILAMDRGRTLGDVQARVQEALEAEGDVRALAQLPFAIEKVKKEIVRRHVFEGGTRVDGRRLDGMRALLCEAGPLPSLHGSSLFSRGNTQVLCTVALGAPEDAQRLFSLAGTSSKRFMVHYAFPPFAVNEIRPVGGVSRREVGHGALAEKALLAVLPAEASFPYSVRVTSECLASDGSSSMATVCGGSLALMDAGVPLREHVAGVSIGLMADVNSADGTIRDYRLLTDILGLEDYMGDMDFKIAGTRGGITAVQLDLKLPGVPLAVVTASLAPAATARATILDAMEAELAGPRQARSATLPKIGTMSIDRDFIGRLIGPQGANIKHIQATTGSRLSVADDGTVNIFASTEKAYNAAKDMVEDTVGREVPVGSVHTATVVSIREYGAIVELPAGQQGLVHISELAHHKTLRVEDEVALGQTFQVACVAKDVRGNLKLSRRACLPSPAAAETAPNRPSFSAPPRPPSPPSSILSDRDSSSLSSLIPDPLSSSNSPSPPSSSGVGTSGRGSGPDSSAGSRAGPGHFLHGLRGGRGGRRPRLLRPPPRKERWMVDELQAELQIEGRNTGDVLLGQHGSSSPATNDVGRTEADLNIDEIEPEPKLEVGQEYVAMVRQVRQFGAVVVVDGNSDGVLRFDEGKHTDAAAAAALAESLVVGEEIRVQCISPGRAGARPRFAFASESAKATIAARS
eukprot:SM000131S26756  [mRNA]  locus=s131:368504:374026:- [translate_table: standard]